MDGVTRRSLTAAITLGALAGAAPTGAQSQPIKLLLNTSLSGPVSFFLLAEDRGYLKQAGLSVAFSPGGGAAVVVPQVRHGAYDAGYGDVSALIERIARGPENGGPVAVYTTFNSVPFTIAVPANGTIRTPRDFEGRTLVGHPFDAALITFDMLARASGIDPVRVKIERSPSSMGSQVAEMLGGRGADGVFGFVNTIVAAVTPLGIDAAKELRFINYADYLPDMYGNSIFVTREMYRDNPRAIGPLIRAFNRGLSDTVKDPDAAIDALQKRGSTRRDVDRARLIGTLRSEMAHPEGSRIGIGDMDDARLRRLIDLVVKTKNLPRTPSVREVFDRQFLPPRSERITSLAR